MMQNVEKEQSSTIAALAKERMRVHEERENSKYLRQTVTELECQLKRIQSIMKVSFTVPPCSRIRVVS